MKPAETEPKAPSWVVVYSTHSRYRLLRWVHLMDQAGIPARYAIRGAQTQLEAPQEYYDVALEFLAANRHPLIAMRQRRVQIALATQIAWGVVGSFPGMMAGCIMGQVIVNLYADHSADIPHPDVYVLIWTGLGALVGAVMGAVCAYPAESAKQAPEPLNYAPSEGFRTLPLDTRRYSAVRVVELLRRNGIRCQFSLQGRSSVIEVDELQLPDAIEILNKNLSDRALLRDALLQPTWLRTRTLAGFGAVVALLLSGGLLAGSTSQYLMGHISLPMAVILNSAAMIVCLATCLVLMWELQRKTIV